MVRTFTRTEAENEAMILAKKGWQVVPHRAPLRGQEGFICYKDGKEERLFWNTYGAPLQPILVPCRSDRNLLEFLLMHREHEMSCFKTEDTIGLVCYCNASIGQSIVMAFDLNSESSITQAGWDVLEALHRGT